MSYSDKEELGGEGENRGRRCGRNEKQTNKNPRNVKQKYSPLCFVLQMIQRGLFQLACRVCFFSFFLWAPPETTFRLSEGKFQHKREEQNSHAFTPIGITNTI